MAALIPPIFPLKPLTYPGFSVHRRPTFATISQESKQGRLTAAAQQLVPLWEFELTYEFLRDKTQNIIPPLDQRLATKTELTKILELFLCCASQYGEFLFLDWTDNSRTNQFIASGDGDKVTFPFIRLIVGDTGVYFAEEVGAINDDFDVTIYVDGSEVAPGPGTWDISEDFTSVVFSSPPALNSLITSSFHYYYRCRWISDYQEVEEFVNLYWEAKSVRFRSIYKPPAYDPPQPIPPINPPNPPIPVETLCLKDFQWWNRTPILTRIGQPGPTPSAPLAGSLDKFGYLYVYEGSLNGSVIQGHCDIFRAVDGTVVASPTQADLADAIDAWYGSSIVVRTGAGFSSAYGFPVKVIKGGDYLLAYLGAMNGPSGGSVARWYAVLDPQEDGSLSVVGACYASAVLPYTKLTILEIANGRSNSDPILAIANSGLGGQQVAIQVLPSIDEMSSPASTYVDFPCRIPPTLLYPLGTLDLSYQLLAANGNNHGAYGGFILQNTGGDTILYMYLNRPYMDLCLNNSIALADKEVKQVIAPAHPYGAMIKINLGGDLDFDTLSTTPLTSWMFGTFFGRDAGSYSIDNANWKISVGGIPAIPFPDEYTYISLGNNAGGTDAYEVQPGAVVKRPNGKWWILFYMAGVKDVFVNGGSAGDTLTSFRIFEWDPDTEIAIQLVYDSCLLHTANNINAPGGGAIFPQQDYFLIFDFIDEDDGAVTIDVYGPVFKDRFYRFTPV